MFFVSKIDRGSVSYVEEKIDNILSKSSKPTNFEEKCLRTIEQKEAFDETVDA